MLMSRGWKKNDGRDSDDDLPRSVEEWGVLNNLMFNGFIGIVVLIALGLKFVGISIEEITHPPVLGSLLLVFSLLLFGGSLFRRQKREEKKNMGERPHKINATFGNPHAPDETHR